MTIFPIPKRIFANIQTYRWLPSVTFANCPNLHCLPLISHFPFLVLYLAIFLLPCSPSPFLASYLLFLLFFFLFHLSFLLFFLVTSFIILQTWFFWHNLTVISQETSDFYVVTTVRSRIYTFVSLSFTLNSSTFILVISQIVWGFIGKLSKETSSSLNIFLTC